MQRWCLRRPSDLEDFLRIDPGDPAVMALPLRMAVAHAQFEAIHPFGDGNGRVGRLLPPLMMAAEGLPPLYLAGFLKKQQCRYYDSLAGVQLRGRWTEWLTFFLRGVADAADTGLATGRDLLDIRAAWLARTAHIRSDSAAKRMLDMLLGAPVQTAASVRAALGISAQAANTGIAALIEAGILTEVTGRRWGRTFHAHAVLSVLQGTGDFVSDEVD